MSRDASAEVSIGSDRAGVVAAGGLVVGRDVVGTAVLRKELLQTIAVGRPHGTITDHLLDLGGGARVLDILGGIDAGIAAALAVVGLHETRIDDTIVGSVHAHATVAFLHDDSQNEASIDTRLASNLGDGALHVGHFALSGVGNAPLGARRAHDRLVALEEIIKARHPVGHGGPSI